MYSHYYPQSGAFSDEQWTLIMEGVSKVFSYCKKCKIVLQLNHDVDRKPEVTDKFIRFNGRGNLSLETFYLPKKPVPHIWESEGEPVFHYCKTSRRPYDLAVRLCLLWVHSAAPGVLRITSDGTWDDDWMDAREAYEKIFGQEPTNPIVEETKVIKDKNKKKKMEEELVEE
jgi:hypothetical protein